MSVGHARVAIRRMLTPRHPRRYRPWQWIVAGGALALGAALWLGGGGIVMSLVLGIGGAAALNFMLLGRLLGWIVLVAVFGLGLGFIPLFGVLGFELAVAATIPAAIMGADVGSALARAMQRIPAAGVLRADWPGRTLARGATGAALLAIAIISIPAWISTVRGLWLPTCDWWFGIRSYLLLPVITAGLAAALGHAIGALAGPRRFLGAGLAQLPAIGVAIAAFWRFYTEPPVFTYNAILGYFPGNLYDENVQLRAALLWSRLEQVLWVIAALALVAIVLDVPSYRARRGPRPAGRRGSPLLIAVAAAASGFLLHLQSGALGYAIDAEDIQEELGGRLETAHFIIYYAHTPELEEEMPLIARDHELRYAQVTAQIGPGPAQKLRSYYFASRDQKWRLFGARNVEMAKPWLGDIYLDHRAFPHTSLRHEIAHAVASRFGDPIFGVAARRVFGIPVFMSPGLIEGLAVALDWPGPYDRPNPHESVRGLQLMGKLPPLDRLFGLQFFSVGTARGYTMAGSFLRFLLERHGAERLRALYGSGGDFEAAYGMPRDRLEAEWREMLSQIVVPETTALASAERFRRPTVFARPCPHAIAARREAAYRSLGNGDRGEAIALMRRVCEDAPDEPHHHLELGDFLSGDDDGRAEAERLWSRVAGAAETVTSTLRAQAYRRLAHAAGERGELERVRELVTAAVALPLEGGERRTVDAMAFALAHPGPAGGALRAYFFPRGSGFRFPAIQHALLAVIAEPELGFGHYLLGLQRANLGDDAGAAASLELALARELPGLLFVENAARRLAVIAYRIGDHNRLSLAITILAGSAMSSGDHLLARDWLDRMSFDLTGTLAR